MTAIDVRSISKSFRIPSVRRETVREHVLDLFRRHPSEVFRVLHDISFTVPHGGTFGIMGRNGSGKSTLLKILTGIYQADSGKVRASGPITPILELGGGLNPELDAIDNIFLLGSVMGLSLPEIHTSIDDILAFAEVERFANLKLKHYSSGMSSRLAYSVAFRAVTGILILDEVFAVGDAAFTEKCEARFREIRAAGHTIVLVSHAPDTVADICGRAVLLEGGRIVVDGTGADVAEAYTKLLSHAPRDVPVTP
jgi:ABC-type polysaccharide/polyol phosphate transport system ATPase subunit